MCSCHVQYSDGGLKMNKELHMITLAIKNLTGFDGMLAGGCVRDTLLFTKPKDYDFLIYTEEEVDLDMLKAELISKGCDVSYQFNEGCSIVSEASITNGNDFTYRFKYGLAFKYMDKYIDLLFCHHPVEYTIQRFDCNLNRLYYSLEDGIIGSIPETLEFAPWVPTDRRNYLTNKFNKAKNLKNFRQH